MTRFPIHRKTMVALIVGAMVGCAYADDKDFDRLKLRAGLSRSEDNNYLRAPESKAVADKIDSQTLDLNVMLPYGQQRLELEANFFTSQHQTLTQFDFSGKNYSAAWRWSLTPKILGVLSTKHTEMLNSTADSIDPTLRNKNVADLDTLTVGYLLGGPWQLFTDYSKASSVNEHALLGTTDIHYQSVTIGASYAPSVGNTLSYTRRLDTGTSISDYSGNGHALTASYALNGSTSLKARIGYLEQRFAIDRKYDFSGFNGGIEGTWHITGKTSIVGGWQRDLMSFQSQDSTYARIDTFSVAPSWQIAPTLSVGLQYKQAVRESLGNLNGSVNTRQDRTRDTVWTVQWQPRSYISLRGSYAQLSRTSNVVDQDFFAHVVMFGVQFIF